MSRSSRTCSFCLWPLLLIFSLVLCSCNARLIGVMKKQDQPSRSSPLSNKHDENSSQTRAYVSSNPKPSNEEVKMVGSLVGKIETKKQPKSPQKVKDQQELKDIGHHERKKIGGADHDIRSDRQSAASVTWKVPHPKSGERQPGFNLDYDPPQTHPPVHN